MNIIDPLAWVWNRVLLRILFSSAETFLGAWTSPVSGWLVTRAARRLPARVAEECQKQWLADLHGLPGWLQLRSAVSLLTSRDIASIPEPRTNPSSKAMPGASATVPSASGTVAIELPPLAPYAGGPIPAYDGLTGLCTRRPLTKRLNRSVGRPVGRLLARRRGLSVLLVDIDELKVINRELGHLAGDALLKECARRLRGGLRGRGLIGRFGGDQFAVLLPNTPTQTALEIGEHLRHACDFSLRANAGTFEISASFGIASLAPGLSADDLWSHVDVALGRAKRDGRNCVRYFECPAL